MSLCICTHCHVCRLYFVGLLIQTKEWESDKLSNGDVIDFPTKEEI